MEYSIKVCEVADIIRDSLCLGLQLKPEHHLHDKFYHPTEVPHSVLKLISYPSIETNKDIPGQEQPQQQGVGAHTDTNFLTLVLQDESTVGSLQAFSEGEWIDVPFNHGPNVLICNLGEQAETWSRGYFLATPHRVIIRNTAKSHQKSSRISVPLFYNPILSASMEPLPEECIEKNYQLPWERPEDYLPWRRKDNAMIASVGENTFKSLARSHPKVFAKHHPDLKILSDGRIIRNDEESKCDDETN
jgi:isopenicillin N synthase-like dioxygenase